MQKRTHEPLLEPQQMAHSGVAAERRKHAAHGVSRGDGDWFKPAGAKEKNVAKKIDSDFFAED